jgi:hypothetical protein
MTTDWPVRYAAVGFRPVLLRDDRTPAEVGWQAGTDLPRLRRLAWAGAAIGLVPVAPQVVLDIDPRNSPDPEVVARIRRLGTLSSGTRSGGSHHWFWYRLPEGRRFVNLQGVDVKGPRSLVVEEPTRGYAWRNWGSPLLELPPGLVELVTAAVSARPGPGGWGGSVPDDVLRGKVEAEVYCLERLTEGRNQALYRAALACLRLADEGAWGWIEEELVSAAMRAGKDERSCRRTVASAAHWLTSQEEKQ